MSKESTENILLGYFKRTRISRMRLSISSNAPTSCASARPTARGKCGAPRIQVPRCVWLSLVSRLSSHISVHVGMNALRVHFRIPSPHGSHEPVDPTMLTNYVQIVAGAARLF